MTRTPKVPSDAEYDAFYRLLIGRAVHRAYLLYGDPDQAQDAAQEAMMAAYEQWQTKIGRLGQDERWRFIVKVLANKRIDNLRRLDARRRALNKLYRRHADSLSIVHVDTDVQVREAVRLMLTLPPRQRVIAVLHWIEEMPLAEISATLGMSSSTARSHLDRARTTLRRQLGDPQPCISTERSHRDVRYQS
jgi:RNA polymerase sigma-70 factor, ECF subfamily